MSKGPSFRGVFLDGPPQIFLWGGTPPRGSVKLNFDGFCFHNSAAGRFIIRDWAGRLIKAGAAPYGDTSILVAEARALQDGLQEVIKKGFQSLEIEGDNIMLIQAIKGPHHMPWKINLIVKDILHYLNQLSHVSISHIYPEANLAVDWSAKQGHGVPSATIWESLPSSELKEILGDDLMGRTLVRRGV